MVAELGVVVNGFTYTAAQAHKIGSSSADLSISTVGDSLLFRSDKYQFWTLWDLNMNAIVGVRVGF